MELHVKTLECIWLIFSQNIRQAECLMSAPLPGKKATSWHWPLLVLLLTVLSLLPHSKNHSETISDVSTKASYVQSAAGFEFPLDG